MFSGAFAEKVGTNESGKKTKTKQNKKKEEGEGREKKKTMFPCFPSLANACYEAIFRYDLGKSTNNEVGIGLTRSLSSLFG